MQETPVRRFLPEILLGSALVLNAAANILMKYSALRTRELPAGAGLVEKLAARLHPAFVVGLILFAMNVFAYQAALRTPRMKLSVAYPVMVSGGYVIILGVSWFLFRERLGPVQYAGVGLILGGIWMVVR
jgi:multidrug transporter EmrE-like cation transporter